MLEWLRKRAAEVEILTSVCTGSMLPGFAGLLDGMQATTHWRSLDGMQATTHWRSLDGMRDSFPEVIVEHEQHAVSDDQVGKSYEGQLVLQSPSVFSASLS
jgi:transcriptional regulator GlxA family with amidase domain